MCLEPNYSKIAKHNEVKTNNWRVFWKVFSVSETRRPLFIDPPYNRQIIKFNTKSFIVAKGELSFFIKEYKNY